MKKQIGLAFAASLLSITIIGTASAADMAVKARPMVAPPVVPGWQGFYIGGNVGAGWADTTFTGIPVTGDHFLLPGLSRSTGWDDANVVGGIQAGYNWQWDRFVLGIEGTYSGSGVKNSTGIIVDPVFAGQNTRLNSKIDQYATIVGRAGFAPTNDWLLYGKGGYAAGHIKTHAEDFFPLPATLQHFSDSSAWHNGWTAGVGVEYKWMRNWVFGVEYDYYSFDTKNHSNATVSTVAGAPGAPTFYSQDVKTNMSTVVLRASYLFNPAAVVARY
ncbi:outer membrane protein [Bradyrhizobium sp. SZCCHNR1070]|uniref:outer membrane protein n=2 Tax=unclassified Bradyrhizobium TaxID=2631580 RepID=UPI0029162775|nr:outer membrane beta-barrel protein [Bradyrhizobium sp. SZCCHNR1070]